MNKIFSALAVALLLTGAASAQNQDKKNTRQKPSRVTTEQPTPVTPPPSINQTNDPLNPNNNQLAQPVPPPVVPPVSNEINNRNQVVAPTAPGQQPMQPVSPANPATVAPSSTPQNAADKR